VWFDFSNCDRYSSKEEFEKTLLNNVPQRKWVGLTEEEIDRLNFLLVEGCQCSLGYVDNVEEFAQSIEAKLREKNGC
jgi:4-aminobutyrate aminotransferase-like enzyme